MAILQLLLVNIAAMLLASVYGQDTECKDRGPCPYVYKRYCSTMRYRIYMERNCPKFCGYCKPYIPCSKRKYGCCLDGKTAADGADQRGCPLKLCYDKFVTGCLKDKKKGTCNTSNPQIKARMKEECPYSCGVCKHRHPGERCKDTGFGCCWDGTAALGPNKKGCAPCVDFYGHTCNQWGRSACSSGSYRIRSAFMEPYCPVTCGLCNQCLDITPSSQCRVWKSYGFCTHYKHLMKNTCEETCNLCNVSEKSLQVIQV